MGSRRKSAGKRFRRENLMVRAYEGQQCVPCAKWLRGPNEFVLHMASRGHRAKTSNVVVVVEASKMLPQVWVEYIVAKMEEAEREQREKLIVMARTNPEACRAEIWLWANEKNPLSIQRPEECGVVARRILRITTNTKIDLSCHEISCEGWDDHGHTGKPWEPLRTFKGKRNQVEGVERFIANARLY